MDALGVALVSAAVLLLQLVQTRVFSVMLWHHLTYLVVTFTLLGFAAGGAALACRPRWLQGDVSGRLARAAALFGLAVLAAYAIMTRFPPSTSHTRWASRPRRDTTRCCWCRWSSAASSSRSRCPRAGAKVGRTYAVNMAGSALGCAVYVPALRVLGGEGCVVLSAGVALLAAACFAARRGADGARHGALAGACGVGALLLAVVAVVAPTSVLKVPVATSKAMSQQLLRDPTQSVLLTKWDPLCRIDVVGPADPASNAPRTIYQDGDASTVMAAGHAEASVNVLDKEGLAYILFRGQAPKVLAIGIGGGIDILQAAAARRELPPGKGVDFTGVEINATTYGLMTGDYAALNGDRYHLPGVHIELDEGRSWLRRSDEQYDIIQMTGTDTYAALASGSYVMSESYLYTAEAYDDFLAHLAPDGVISVLRFRFTPPREELRLAGIAVDALRRQGSPDPADDVVMIGFDGPKVTLDDGQQIGIDYVALLIRKRPFTHEEVAAYEKYCHGNARTHVMYAPGVAGGGRRGRLLRCGARRREGDGRSPRQDDFSVDDADRGARHHEVGGRVPRPLSLQPRSCHRRQSLLLSLRPLGRRARQAVGRRAGKNVEDIGPAGKAAQEYSNIVGGEPIGLIMLMTVLLESALLVAVLVLVPLWLFRREGLRVDGAGRWVTYFFGLGAGYILVEVACMQRFVLFLGNPGYAISCVLLTFLLFSGLGSAFAGRRADPRRTLTAALIAVVLLVLALGIFLHPLFEATLRLPLPARPRPDRADPRARRLRDGHALPVRPAHALRPRRPARAVGLRRERRSLGPRLRRRYPARHGDGIHRGLRARRRVLPPPRGSPAAGRRHESRRRGRRAASRRRPSRPARSCWSVTGRRAASAAASRPAGCCAKRSRRRPSGERCASARRGVSTRARRGRTCSSRARGSCRRGCCRERSRGCSRCSGARRRWGERGAADRAGARRPRRHLTSMRRGADHARLKCTRSSAG